MPCVVHVWMLDCTNWVFYLDTHSQVRDLRRALRNQTGVRGGDQRYYVEGRRDELQDAEYLLDLVPWFHMQDMVAPHRLRRMHFGIEVFLVLSAPDCVACGAEAHWWCGRCKKVRYCSDRCARACWPLHQRMCMPR